tara:strand:- start:3442 stop:3972 length:531 start_codon:yes stop_codon:yes gene_type:complete
MKSKKITINDIEVTVHSDGSISKPNNNFKDKRIQRTFGYENGRGYKQVGIGNKMFLMHRLIAKALLLDFLDYLEVDHIDGDKANNNANNLRMATRSDQLRAHMTKRKGCSSRYRGVTWDNAMGKWKAQCSIDNRIKYIGLFTTEVDAALSRDAYAHSKGFPKEGLNFPQCFAVDAP